MIDVPDNFIECYMDKKSTMPKFGGIYYIICDVTSKHYPGRAVNFHGRFLSHLANYRAEIRNKVPLDERKALYVAFEKYGLEAFRMVIIERVEDMSKIVEIENQYLEREHKNNKWTYNMVFAREGHALGTEKTRKKFKVVRPDGKIIEIDGIKQFCAKHPEVPKQVVQKLINGKTNCHNGWRLFDGANNVPWDTNYFKERTKRKNKTEDELNNTAGNTKMWNYVEVISPEGKFYFTNNLSELARQLRPNEFQKTKDAFTSLIAPHRVWGREMHGWKIYKIHWKQEYQHIIKAIEEKPRKRLNGKASWEKLVLCDDKEEYEVDNLGEFCDIFGLTREGVYGIIYGRNYIHKGFRIKEIKWKDGRGYDPKPPKTKWVKITISDGVKEYEITNINQFCEDNPYFEASSLSALINRKIEVYKKFKIKEIQYNTSQSYISV